MSKKQDKTGRMGVLLDEIEAALKDATPEQVSTALGKAGLKGRAEENRKRLRRAMSVDYRTDMAPSVAFREAALTEFGAENASACRIRIKFALAAEPALAKKLGVNLDEISDLTDDVVVDYYHKLRELKP